ncbi:MAG TPA: DNA helicase UvrD, partial [Flavobacteriaceae bacterium]|nr:DNA helicase UvrD [Flavobacteriaceae bacterium]
MFKIYNASAGSGKTYTLVKDYLKIILTSEAYLPHRHILAITFTNKAVDEMKRRILDTLMRFSKPSILQSNDALFLELSKDLKLTSRALHLKSRALIHKILHNYGSFEVSTIDKFNQKLIRTFAYDLELPMDFEVELDKDFLLQQAVDRLIHKAGHDPELTKVLVQYALSKTDDDKSWDIALDLNKIAQLLTKETAHPFLNTLSSQDLKAFRRLSGAIEKEQGLLSNQIVTAAAEVLEKFRASGLEFSDFNRGSIPKYFLALASKQMDVKLDAVWQLNITTTPFYTQKTPQQTKEKIDSIRPFVTMAFEATRKALYRLKYLRNIQQNATPLSVITLIQKELNALKKEQNLILISEFNSLISKEIKSQPTPFIYERIGEKFEHYFIDEFQDTSEMQWKNLTPLMVNALASAKGSVLLVGDPKQAIYRWRGGHPEQFIDLINNTTSFPTQAKVFDLPVNYRSCENIVAFNNAFFEHVSQVLFTNKAHQKIYQSAPQKP